VERCSTLELVRQLPDHRLDGARSAQGGFSKSGTTSWASVHFCGLLEYELVTRRRRETRHREGAPCGFKPSKSETAGKEKGKRQKTN